jgi:ribose transport system substrate-binding protein
MMKKSLAILLSGTMLLSAAFMTGCGGGSSSEAPKSSAASEASTPASSAAPEASEAGSEAPASSAAPEASEAGSAAPAGDVNVPEAAKASYEKLLAAEESLMTTDNHPMMAEGLSFDVPAVDGDAAAMEELPETDKNHWHYKEYLDWDQSADAQFPESPADGQEGKKVILIVHGAHAWTTCYTEAFKAACDAVGMTYDIYDPNWDQANQDSYVDQAINERPDAIVVIPVSADHATQQFKKITDAGIPAFCSNTTPEADAMNFIISYTGPNDWYQMRTLAAMLGESMEGKGGVAYITHNVGGSPYYARCYGPMTELAEKYPDIETLDIQSPGFEASEVKQVVADWITKFGDKLNAIVLADDSDQAIGAVEACQAAERTDIKIVAAGISKQGLELVKSGDLFGMSYQTCQGDAGLAVRTVSEWFCGIDVARVNYLSTDIATKDNASSFEPCQW